MRKIIPLLSVFLLMNCAGVISLKSVEPFKVFVTEDNTGVYKKARTISGRITTVDKMDTLLVVGTESVFYYVKLDSNTYGYINKKDVMRLFEEIEDFEKAVVIKDNTPIYKDNNIFSSKIISVNTLDTLSLIDKKGEFFQIVYEDTLFGFVKKGNLEIIGNEVTSTSLIDNDDLDKYVNIKYDKFENNTTYKTKKSITLKSTGLLAIPQLTLSAMAICPDKGNCKPSFTHLCFVSTSKDWKYLQYRELILLIDGERMNIGKVSHDGKIYTSSSSLSVSVIEHMFATIPIDSFTKLANARIVEGKLGITEFVMPYKERKCFRKLLEALNVKNY